MPSYDLSLDPYGVEASQNDRRRQLAEMLVSQGMSPTPVYSNGAGIAKAMMIALGQMDAGKADRDQQALAQRRTGDQQAEMGRIIEAAGGTDRAALAKILAQSSEPSYRQAGLGMLIKPDKEEEPYTLKPGEIRYGHGGKVLAAAPDKPEKEPDAVRTFKAALEGAGIDPASDMGKHLFQQFVTRQATHQPAPSVTVNTDKKFGQVLAGEVAQQVAQSADAARGALDTLNTAKQINDAIASGKVMAGPGTSGIMFMQQAIGAPSTQDGLVQTRQVIQGLSQMTLNSRKQLKGQGQISDFEGKLLAKAASGDIDNLTVPEIKSLVSTATRLANSAITQHKSYLDKIKADPELKNLAPFFDFQVPQAGSNPSVDELVKKYGG
jgi:hypothetical protein